MKSVPFVCLFLLTTVVFAQDKKVYTTTSGELIFSFADITSNGSDQSSVLRFSPVFNIQNWVNIDQSENFGLFTGLSVRNIGLIYKEPTNSNVKIKARTYNLGIPVGVKIGNLSDKFIFLGYELEFPIHYKEKIFINDEKEDKATIWFSDRVPALNHSLMAGIQLPYGATLKFKYYLTPFFKEGYQPSDDLGVVYSAVDANVFYFSLNFGLLKDTGFYYNDK
ncbi:MAG: hypothetical protein JNJ65_09500 [Cyclobacteriaceae bacterium]|nr:hypothetical protein [Cyclobacteriaceae bacterium]